MLPSAPRRTPPHRERCDANQQRGGNCQRTRCECRCRRHTGAGAALSRQIASPEVRGARGVAADAIDAEAGGALSRRRACAALGDAGVGRCRGRGVGRRLRDCPGTGRGGGVCRCRSVGSSRRRMRGRIGEGIGIGSRLPRLSSANWVPLRAAVSHTASGGWP